MAKRTRPIKQSKFNSFSIEIASDVLGAVKVTDIPLRDQTQFDQLFAADEDPLQVVVKVKAGRGNKGFGNYYGPGIMESMANQINSGVVVGYEGHTPESDLGYVKREIATYWLGAIYSADEKSVYVRGLIAKNFEKLKLEIRAGIIGEVSLYGKSSYKSIYDENGYWSHEEVESLDLLSLDWTPPGLAGMETELIATEMDDNKGGKDMKGFARFVTKARKVGLTKEIDDLGVEVTEENLVDLLEGTLEDIDKNATKIEEFDKIAEAVRIHLGKESITDVEVTVAVMEMIAANTVIEETIAVAEMDKLLAEKVKQPAVQAIAREMMGSVKGKNKETIASELETILSKESIKTLLGASYVNSNRSNANAPVTSTDGIKRKAKQLG